MFWHAPLNTKSVWIAVTAKFIRNKCNLIYKSLISSLRLIYIDTSPDLEDRFLATGQPEKSPTVCQVCVCVCVCVRAHVCWCLTLCNPMDCSLLISSVLGISQARTLKWVAISFSRGSSQLRDWTWVCCIAGGFLTTMPLSVYFYQSIYLNVNNLLFPT